jgi:G:T-mismatch repair DNA endonuclease (very short patch repair protein)
LYICPICGETLKGRGFHHLKHGDPLPSSCFKKGCIPINKGKTGQTYSGYRKRIGAHSEGWKMSEEEKAAHKGQNSGNRNGMAGDKYLHSKLIECSICGKEVHSRAMASHLTSHNPLDKEKARIRMSINSHKRPNKSEIKLQNIINSLGLSYHYVGDGSLMLGQPPINPDFVSSIGVNKVIELFGHYWHASEDESSRITRLKDLGYSALVIWESELKSLDKLERKLLEF